ncbi:MAG: hypothetical protein KH230_22560 [Enterocloster asparagiformis]|nr:hypothetical protein [Enterocloster asparagiformis]
MNTDIPVNSIASSEKSVVLTQLVSNVKLWVQQIREAYGDKISVENLADEADFLRYIMETDRYMAELVVEPAGFHPHRFVWFAALDKEKDPSQQYAYSYCDDGDSSLSDIFRNLNKGVELITK